MQVGLFFGSFNPVHVGHMIIASHMVQRTTMDEVWMVVSPQNPFKDKKSLAPDYDRLHLVRQAIGDHTKIRASNIEFELPQPSYTIDTLTYLIEKYPHHIFSLIMGSDNIATLHKWKNYELILERHHIYVYQRPDSDGHPLGGHPHVHMVEAPLLSISASHIRSCIRDGISVQYLVPDAVYLELLDSHLYRN